MNRDFTRPLAGIALLTVLTGCNAMPGNQDAEPTPGAVTSVASPNTESPKSASGSPETTPAPRPTSSAPTPIGIPTPTSTTSYTADPLLRSEFEADKKRNGLYIDEWAEVVGIFLQRESNLFVDLQESEYGDSLKSILGYLTSNEVPEGFETSHEVTVRDNFVIKIWHPDAYHYYSEDTAYEGRSDPLASSPTPTPSSQEQFPVLEPIDTATTELLYSLLTAIRGYKTDNDGDLPSDAYLREQGLLPEGWEWSVVQSPTNPEHSITRVWHPGGQIFNTEETAAYRDTFPKEDMRPEYNFDIDPLIPIIDAQPPRNYTPPASPIPSSP